MAKRDRDFKPEEGQQGNQNWDDQNDKINQPGTEEEKTSSAEAKDRSTLGAGSSQRSREDNVGPLDADLSQLPSEKRMDRGNQTGPGLG